MVSSCSNCGVVTPPEARFCRHCGTPLRKGTTLGGNETVSPLAQTVPLSGEGFTTSSLNTDETGRPAPETKRVGQAEINHLLRHTRFESAPDSKNDGDGSATLDSDYAAPPTGELTEKTPAPAAATAAAPAHSAGRASAINRPRRLWPTVTIVLLLATLSAALLAYYFLRQRQPSNAVELANEANSNQATESINTNTPAEQEGVSSAEPSPEATPQPSPAPSASVEPTRVARAQQEQRESATATPAPAGTSTTPTPTPVAQATPAQTTPSPPATANSNNSATQAAQASSDDFYFQAVNLVNGRHPRTMPRAELLRALQLFQNVRSGQHAAEARRQAAQLGRELDRLNKQSQR